VLYCTVDNVPASHNATSAEIKIDAEGTNGDAPRRFQSAICREKAANKTVFVLVDVLLVGFELVR
jgi:hypothetical protein